MTCEPLRQMLLKPVYCSIARTVRIRAWQLCSAASVWFREWLFEAALSVSIPFSFFVCEDHVSVWSCHKGLPQFAWRNTMEILSILHLTWNSVRALEACFHVALQKNIFWGPQTSWDTAAVHIFPRTEHLCCLALGPVTLLDREVSAERTPAFTIFSCRENKCFFPDQFALSSQQSPWDSQYLWLSD